MAKAKTKSQARRVLNLVRSRGTERDWQIEHATAAGALAAPAVPPPAVDLRAPWWAIGDQGPTGSCVGWASTDGVMRWHMVKSGRLSQKDLLSPRFTWMASKETDEFVNRAETMIEGAGTSLKAAMEILRKYGAVPDKLLPFKINTLMYTGDDNAFYATAASRRVAAYFNLQTDLEKWRTWLATRGPILAGFDVDSTWMNATQTNGLLDMFVPPSLGGHAVCIVGYRRDGRFIIRNSWGTQWGDKGFAYASPAYIQGAFFPESYGITV